MDSKDLYKELEKDNAAQIILALSKLYNQLRQQRLVKWVVWLFRYGTLLDIFGNATDEKIQ